MKKIIMVIAAVLTMATAAMATDGTYLETLTSRDTVDYSTYNNKFLFEFSSTAVPLALVTFPGLMLAAPHFGIEWANESASKISNDIGRTATKAAIMPFRLVGVVLASPFYIVNESFAAGRAALTWAGMYGGF